MAWNRPTEKKVEPPHKRSWKGVVAGVIVVVGAVLAYVVISNSDSKPRDEDNDVRHANIKEVKPSLARQTNDLTEVSKTVATSGVEVAKKPEDLGFYTNKLGEVKRRTGKKVVLHGRKTKRLFACRAENIINSVVSCRPGEMVADTHVPENFKELLQEALINPIHFEETDTEDERQQKQRVIDAKKELKKALLRGEDVAEIIREEKRYLKKQYETYRFYEQGLMDLRKNKATPEQISEYALAAQQMMEKQNLEKKLHFTGHERLAIKDLQEVIKDKDTREDANESGNK